VLQSVSVTLEGVAANAVGGVVEGQAPAPTPVAVTAITTLEVPSETVTLPPEVAGDVATRRIVTVLPLTVAEMLELLDAAVYVPDPPEMVTAVADEQSVNVTFAGLAVIAEDGHAPSARPVRVSNTDLTDMPSETPIDTGLVVDPEGFRRRTETVLPNSWATTLPLPALGWR
jgi:hypothetical protein